MKTILISGASGNLGKALVQYFHNQNYNVVGLVRKQNDYFKSLQNYTEFEVDLTNEISVNDCIEKILKNVKTIDFALFTAGGFTMGNIENTSVENIEQQIQLNFFSAFTLSKPILNQMKKQGFGKIFFTGSMQGLYAHKGISTVAYTLSKSLLFQYAEIINTSVNNTSIKAHVIVPSTIDTPQNREAMPNADFSKWEKPEQIAMVIARYADKPNSKTAIVIKDEI
ncbi:MAG: SDR family NAD(P)-dependent oxidoreductase [Bacteroidia bacterium]|nr:SDR family NAD(P)-dependent oxidoreductase [Bacteroidia bacterium]